MLLKETLNFLVAIELRGGIQLSVVRRHEFLHPVSLSIGELDVVPDGRLIHIDHAQIINDRIALQFQAGTLLRIVVAEISQQGTCEHNLVMRQNPARLVEINRPQQFLMGNRQR